MWQKIKNFLGKCWHYIVLIISVLFVWKWFNSRGNSGNESGRIADDIRKQQSETEERLRKVESGLDDSIGKVGEVGEEIGDSRAEVGEVRDELKDSRETIDRVKERNQASSERLDENERIIQELRKRNKKGEE